MAKRSTGSQDEPVPEKPRISSTKVRAELLRKANMVVLHKKKKDPALTLEEYVDKILSAAVETDYEAMIREESRKKD